MSTYIDYVKSLPLRPAPEVFGLHENANIAKDEQETNKTLSTLLLIRSASGATSSSSEDAEDDSQVLSSEDTMYLVAETTLAKMKPVFNMFDAMDRYPKLG